ncbi:MAG: oxidation resistance protein 1 [Cirrosporium novae-zelandiae]|nr:MAG: oxidation resistance protein 1 [Cirrosporium novae-zelandiae]
MPTATNKHGNGNGIYQPPPKRTASPWNPPPLTPLSLRGVKPSTPISARLLTPSLAEEIRLLLPPRLQLVDEWTLAYSVEQDGTSLATLYSKCERYQGKRSGFVLVVKDGDGGIFGAYLSDAPHPSSHYYGTGECFLWRCTILPPLGSHALPHLSSLPPPPSSDIEPTRSTTISAQSTTSSGTSTPRIRFKAFPYSGINDYMLFCEHSYLSVGGGDGHYGLWLDDVMERGVSSGCPTFGNEPLSTEGDKFDVLGVECWWVGSG